MHDSRSTTQSLNLAIIELNGATCVLAGCADGNAVLEWCLGNVVNRADR
jgi:hypothetical protein